MIENALLRRQLAVLNRQVKRPKLTWRDRSIIVFLASKLRGWKDALMIVQPETLLRWHRDFFRFVWRHNSKAESKPGRPPLSDDDIARIKRLARENATWGAERIRGELTRLGIEQRIPFLQVGPKSPPVGGELSARPVLNGLHHTTSWVATQSVGHGQAQRPIYH
jgi:hypothetical protein